MTTYLAVVQRVPDQAFCIRFPDFPDVEVKCDAIQDVRQQADDALRRALRACAKAGMSPPQPTPKGALECRPEYRSAFVVRASSDEEIES